MVAPPLERRIGASPQLRQQCACLRTDRRLGSAIEDRCLWLMVIGPHQVRPERMSPSGSRQFVSIIGQVPKAPEFGDDNTVNRRSSRPER